MNQCILAICPVFARKIKRPPFWEVKTHNAERESAARLSRIITPARELEPFTACTLTTRRDSCNETGHWNLHKRKVVRRGAARNPSAGSVDLINAVRHRVTWRQLPARRLATGWTRGARIVAQHSLSPCKGSRHRAIGLRAAQHITTDGGEGGARRECVRRRRRSRCRGRGGEAISCQRGCRLSPPTRALYIRRE